MPHRKPPKIEKTPSALVAVAAAKTITSTAASVPGVSPPEAPRATRRRDRP